MYTQTELTGVHYFVNHHVLQAREEKDGPDDCLILIPVSTNASICNECEGELVTTARLTCTSVTALKGTERFLYCRPHNVFLRDDRVYFEGIGKLGKISNQILVSGVETGFSSGPHNKYCYCCLRTAQQLYHS